MQIFKICHHHLIPHFWTASTKSQNQHHLTPTVADNPKLNNLVDCDTYATCGARFSVINAQSCIITETVKQLPHNVAKHGLAYAQYVCIFTFPTVKTVACFFVNIVKVLDIVKCNYTPTAMMPFTSCSDVHNIQGGTYLHTDKQYIHQLLSLSSDVSSISHNHSIWTKQLFPSGSMVDPHTPRTFPLCDAQCRISKDH